MNNSIQYIGLFLLFLLVGACGEGQTASNKEKQPTTVATTADAEKNKTSIAATTTTEKPAPKEAPTTTITPYQLDFTPYDGQWFELEYPKDFSIKKQKNSMEKEDPYRGDISLFLTASDQKITFFAFPIYGNSQPKGIVINETTEAYLDNSKHQQGSIVTIQAKDGSYIREYQYNEFHFWGQQYDTPTTKALYAKAFERFYQSIGATEG